MKINSRENISKFNRAMLRNSVSIALTLVMTPLIFAAGTKRCGWLTVGDYKIEGACVLDNSVGGCSQATSGQVCGVKYQQRTCYDGGNENCSTAWLFGNCRGRQEIQLVCTTMAGWPSQEERICVCK